MKSDCYCNCRKQSLFLLRKMDSQPYGNGVPIFEKNSFMKVCILKRGENNYKKHYQLGGWKGKTHVAHQSPCPAEV